MNTFNASDLIPAIAGFRNEVLANRKACRTDFARSAHDNLVAKLDEIATDLHWEVETEKRLAEAKGTPDGDEWYEFYHLCTCFERRWAESGPVSVADPIYEHVVCEGESCRVGLEYTIVPASELEGLADILDAIRRRTRICFIAARV